MKVLKEKIKESMLSVIPVMIIMLVIGIYLGFNFFTLCSILISTLLLILGIALFTLGADLSMIEIGKTMAIHLLKTRKVGIIVLVSFVVGLVITIAEPDLKVLADQMSAIDSSTLILCVGVGVGIFLAIAVLRIMYQINLKIIIVFFYLVLLLMLFISKSEVIPVAFDSGGVTTGPMSVPFILAMGIGFSTASVGERTQNDSFGLVSLCSIGPIMIVLLLGLMLKSDMSYTYNIQGEIISMSSLLINYLKELMPVFSEVLGSLIPILGVFIVFSIVTRQFNKRQFIKVGVGLVITIIGLVLFFIGVNVGYMPIAYLIGIRMYDKGMKLLILLGLVVGFVIVRAEPAVAVLTEQIEKITQGSIKRKIVNDAIAVGVALAVGVSILRVMTGISLVIFLVIGYLIALLLMIFTPNIFTMIAFDSGGAVTGPMTTSFLLPLIIGICYSNNGNVLTDAFGLVALVALSPLITIQFLGIIYNIKSRRRMIAESINESIVELDWSDR